MFDPSYIINELEKNAKRFQAALSGESKDVYMFKPSADKWCMLEIVCHLYDEEREDFKARLKHVLDNSPHPLPSIDPVAAVTARKYIEQDYNTMLSRFIEERYESISWLKSLELPQWDNAYQHPKFGPLTAKLFLTNWLAHDYHHFR